MSDMAQVISDATGASGSVAPSSTGQAIADCLNAILERCADAEARLGFPGEGGERSFRGWLVSDLLIDLLRWPAERVNVGERFDILLQDADGFPIVTIETKTPGHKASRSERQDFESRLSAFGALRTAYFTNGSEWERLDIFAPTGTLEVRDRSSLRLETAATEEIEAFFAPLFGDRYFPSAFRASRHAVSRENSHILEALAADLDQAIGDLTFFFGSLFDGLRKGKAGGWPRDVTLALFNLWCEKSLLIPPQQATKQLVSRFEKEDLAPRDIVKVLADLGLTGARATAVAESLALLPPLQRRDATAVTEALWPAYESAVDNFCAQTAHVILGRALLYRIGEDQNVFPRLLSGEQMERALAASVTAVLDMPPPATDVLSRVRTAMEDFLPTVYKLGEFDWWLITPEKRASLGREERTWLRQMDGEFERAAQRLLRILNGYFFGRVDVDVWRNVYQHYMPDEERQRLGGFYTPDELVNLILDLAEYTPEIGGLCRLSFIDPACGSGAFVTGALTRLLAHLELDLPCHASPHRRGLPAWKHAEEVLNVVSDCLHAVDLHPFAAFLTTLNVLFLLLPLYVRAREKNPDFTLELYIFSADSLEKPDTELHQQDFLARLNSRVQLTAESFQRYQEILGKRFDRVFGNPPWGGVLKGPLAPVYDTLKKQRFPQEFPAAAQGKYDIYGLFMERALQILKPGGRFGLLTQGSFIDKQWAGGLRQLLATQTRLRYIVDLNPFGQLFFRAMNTPCITVADNLEANDGMCLAVLSTPPVDFKGLGADERRKRAVATVREALTQVAGRRKRAVTGFAHAARISRQQLRETARERWNLAGPSVQEMRPEGWYTSVDLLESFQGVTVGGEGCLNIMLVSEDEATCLGLEPQLVHPVIKGRETTRWMMPRVEKVILYPYDLSGEEGRPAFALDLQEVQNLETREVLRRSGVSDGLDFDRPIDQREAEVVRRQGVNRATLGNLLRHRSVLGLVKYPRAADYLVKHYERLEGRVFKKRNVREFGRQWYEYIWPRDPEVMLGQPKILSPRLTKQVRFALDVEGIIPQDSCICLVPTKKTHPAWDKLCDQLAKVLGRPVVGEEALKYCLAFLNSAYAQERLVTGHRPTPKGFYAVTEEYLREIPIPPPDESATTILDLVEQLVAGADEKEVVRLERELGKMVDGIVKVRSKAT